MGGWESVVKSRTQVCLLDAYGGRRPPQVGIWERLVDADADLETQEGRVRSISNNG